MDFEEIQALDFDWDEGNISHCQKHGVSIEEIEGLFRAGFFLRDDVMHSEYEKREIALGIPPVTERPMFVAFTLRRKGEDIFIRPVSARYMHDREAKRYEQEIT